MIVRYVGWVALLCLLAAPFAAAQDAGNLTDSNGTGNEEPVGGGGVSPILVIAVVIGLALVIGVLVAMMGRDRP